MHVLCALGLIFTLFANRASAAMTAKAVSISASTTNYPQKSNALTTEEKLQNNIKELSVALQKIKLNQNTVSSITMSQNTADYSRYLIYDPTGSQSSSLAGHLTEYDLMYDQIYSLPSAIVEIILSTNFGTTPLRKSNAALIYTRKLSDVNSFLVTFFTQKQNLPTNYFLNPTDNNRPALRPTELDTYSLALGYVRIFSDRFKSKFEISAGQRIQDRPKRYGAELKALYVVSDNKAIRADVGYLVESQVENLNTDLGYQDSKWFESKYIHTINSYVTYGIGYGTEINRESRVWQNSIEQLGNDQALFDLTYDDSKWSLSLAGAYAQYNTGQVGSNLKLEFSWDL